MNSVKLFKSFKLVRNQKSISRQLSFQTQIKVKEKPTGFETEWSSAKKFDDIPKLSPFKFLLKFIPGGDYHGLDLTALHKKMREDFGDITVIPSIFGRPSMVLVYKPEDFEKILRNEGPSPYRIASPTLEFYHKTMRRDLYEEYGSLITFGGEKWLKTRALINSIMLKPQMSKLYASHIDDIAKEFIQTMKRIRDVENEVPSNFIDYVNQWSLESIAYITMSKRLGLLRETSIDPNAEKLIKLEQIFLFMGSKFDLKPSIWKYYQTKGFKELMKVYDDMFTIIMHYIDEAMEKLKNCPSKKDQEESILEKTLKIDKKLAVVISLDSIFAGVDTTSNSFLTTLYCLAKNPEKQQKLRDEILKILPNKSDPLTFENLKEIPYLRAVIKEGMRLYAPVTATMRTTNQDLILSGYQIPKGKEVTLSLLHAFNHSENFEKSEEFIPERWIKSAELQCPFQNNSHPFVSIPFGFGARSCPGRRLAYLEIQTSLVRTVRNFKVEWHHPDMKMKAVLVNFPVSDMKFKLIDF